MIVSAIRDVTERFAREKALRAQLKAVVGKSMMPVSAHRAVTSGQGKKSVLGSIMTDVLPPTRVGRDGG